MVLAWGMQVSSQSVFSEVFRARALSFAAAALILVFFFHSYVLFSMSSPFLCFLGVFRPRHSLFFEMRASPCQEHAFAGRPAVDDRTYGFFVADVKQRLAAGTLKPEAVYAPQLAALEKTLQKSLGPRGSPADGAATGGKEVSVPAVAELRKALNKQVCVCVGSLRLCFMWGLAEL